ncbi:MAG: c-type cytochrome [Cyclobacteriaceae bacterium]|nr:c-type cytochrome [Cyclobacteriaceae bacterium]
MESYSPHDRPFVKMISLVLVLVVFLLIAMGVLTSIVVIGPKKVAAWLATPDTVKPTVETGSNFWQAPDWKLVPEDEQGKLIRYGRDLIVQTSSYLGPNGSVKAMSNGMNCQNCHLDAGTKLFGNNYSAVAATYPKFRPRSGTEETIEKRVNDCFERSLNGLALAENSKEMKAIVAYINWVGKDVPKGKSPEGSGLVELPFLDRPANVENGKVVYEKQCVVCHGKEGNGIALADGTGWQFPPLWGEHSYNQGAGLYRLSRFAGYVKANMPLGATFDNPQLTDEEAWDVAAYVNALPRPEKDLSQDWPDISKKPIDHPFGPFADEFDETQHKFGPFKPIQEKRKAGAK